MQDVWKALVLRMVSVLAWYWVCIFVGFGFGMNFGVGKMCPVPSIIFFACE